MKRSHSLISSSSSSKAPTKYHVFLSFMGETRYKFTSHLRAALCQKGICTYLDDKLDRGKSISPELENAIENSRCSVIVLSENYASSSWCLDELVKILECRETYEQIVLPIFYYVDPAHVRKQSGSFDEAFRKHEQVLSDNLEKVQIWRDALTEVANLAGYHLHDGGNEANIIQDCIVDVLKGLGDKQSSISKDLVSFCKGSENLVGMASRLEKLDQYVRPSSSDGVRFIGICGMGGIGKTTLARAYYKWKSCEFESSSFLPNVRETCEKEINGLANLKNRLLSELLDEEPTKMRDAYKGMDMIKDRLCYKKFLIILDDVDKEDQLEELVGEDDWLSSGSRVLVTTRNEGLLPHKNCTIYRAEQLNESEALQLFDKKAFPNGHRLDNFKEMSERAIAYAKGLPLALKVLGSLLRGKTTNEWESAFLRLKEHLEEEIIKVLRITFDELKKPEKNIFLDIACFFNGYPKDYIIQIMDGRHFQGAIGIRTLIDKSLISEEDILNFIRMHDLLEEMGKEIVREQYPDEPGRWSRIWDANDLCRVLDKNTGTEEVEAIVCTFREAKISCLEALSNMKKLRLVFIDSPPYVKPFYGLPACLSNESPILSWTGFPFRNLPSSFRPDIFVVLILQQSEIEQLWNNSIKPLNNLKIIDLSYSSKFTKFEDFKVVPNLEKLILEDCYALVEVHPSITLLRGLTSLNLKGCTSLENLPTTISDLESLEVLQLSHCKSLRILPEDLGNLKSLKKLHLGFTGVTELPSSVESLENLEIVFSPGKLSRDRISGRLDSLKEVDLSAEFLDDEIFPEDLGCFAFLEVVKLKYNDFSYLPACFKRLTKLRILDLRDCEDLKLLGPDLPASLEMVKVDGCISLNSFLDPSDQRCNLRCSATCLNCFDLVRKQGSKKTAFAALKRYLQNPPNASKRFDILLPGNEIPAWFTHQSSGTSISFLLDPNLCNTKWMGLAISVIPEELRWGWFSTCKNIRIDGQDCGFELLVKSPEFIRDDCPDHPWLWLFYLPRDIYFQTKELQYNNCSTRIEFSFENNTKNQFGWGVRLVCEQDISDLDLHSEDEDLDNRYEYEDEDEVEDEDEDEEDDDDDNDDDDLEHFQ